MSLDLPPPFPIQITFSSLILVVGIAFSLLMAFALWLKPYHQVNDGSSRDKQEKRISYNPNRLLTILLLVFGLLFLEHFLEVTGYFYYIPRTIVLSEPANFLIAPLIYGYVYCLSRPGKVTLRAVHLIHLLPFLFALLLYLPWILSDLEGQFVLFYADAYLQGVSTRVNVEIKGLFDSTVVFDLSEFKAGLIHRFETIAGVVSVFFIAKYQGYFHIVVFIVYLCLSIKHLLEHRRMMRDVIANNRLASLRWFYHFFALILVGVILYGSQVVYAGSMSFGLRLTVELLVRSCAVASVVYLGFRAIHQPHILSLELAHAFTLIGNASQGDSSSLAVTNPKEEKYNKSSLPLDLAPELMKSLDDYMLKHRLYLDGDLSLPRLAECLDMSVHDVSQVINSQAHVSFYDYVNAFRVKHFKEQLMEEHGSLTIIELAIASGFNSKSAFYSAFKKSEGITPSQWKKQNANT